VRANPPRLPIVLTSLHSSLTPPPRNRLRRSPLSLLKTPRVSPRARSCRALQSYEIRIKSTPQAFPLSEDVPLAHGPPRLILYILPSTYHSPLPSFPSRLSYVCCVPIYFSFLTLVPLSNGQCTPSGMSPDYSHYSFYYRFLTCHFLPLM
jgi:hypothetical protein